MFQANSGKVIDKTLFKKVGQSVSERALHHDREGTLDEFSWRMLADMNLWRIPVRSELGGLGGTWLECVECLEEVARECEDLGFLITSLGHIGSLRLLCDYGDEEQKHRWIPGLLKGNIAVTAMTEECGGSDLSKMQLAAVKTAGQYLLNGKKTHITNAPVATMGLLAGRIPALGVKKDITLFFLDLNVPGISIGPVEMNLGLRTSPTADIDLENVSITECNIIGAQGGGLNILHDIISFERALYGVIAAGLIERMAQLGMQRSLSRKAFGKNIAEFQYVQDKLVGMKMSSTICRSLTYEALRMLEEKHPESSLVCSSVKYQAALRLVESAGNLMQIYGHQGYSDPKIGKFVRDAAGMKIAGGTNDIQKVNIFKQMLGTR